MKSMKMAKPTDSALRRIKSKDCQRMSTTINVAIAVKLRSKGVISLTEYRSWGMEHQ